MTETCCWSAIDMCAGQVNRNDCDGNVLDGPEDVVVSCNFVDFSATPIAGESTEQKDPNGQGGYCAERESSSTIEGYEVELTLCSKTDAALMEILGIWDLVKDADGNCVGVKAKCCTDECNCDPGEETCANPGITLHIWHIAWCGKKRHPLYKWAVTILPNVVFDPASVDITRNNEFNQYTISGRANCNENYGNGPGDIVPDPDGLEECWAEILTNEGPEEMCNCDVCGYSQDGHLGAVTK